MKVCDEGVHAGTGMGTYLCVKKRTIVFAALVAESKPDIYSCISWCRERERNAEYPIVHTSTSCSSKTTPLVFSVVLS